MPLVTGETGAGLKPPLLSFVGPNGIPVGPTVEADPMPSGDVIIAGPVGAIVVACARLAPQLIRIAMVDAMTSRTGTSVQQPVWRTDRIELCSDSGRLPPSTTPNFEVDGVCARWRPRIR